MDLQVTRHGVAVVACLVTFLVFIPAAQALAQPAHPQLMRSWVLADLLRWRPRLAQRHVREMAAWGWLIKGRI